jgi:hypothetical protein
MANRPAPSFRAEVMRGRRWAGRVITGTAAIHGLVGVSAMEKMDDKVPPCCILKHVARVGALTARWADDAESGGVHVRIVSRDAHSHGGIKKFKN